MKIDFYSIMSLIASVIYVSYINCNYMALLPTPPSVGTTSPAFLCGRQLYLVYGSQYTNKQNTGCCGAAAEGNV